MPSAIHQSHPMYANNRLRQFSQFVRVIEESDIQLQRCMRGASRVRSFQIYFKLGQIRIEFFFVDIFIKHMLNNN